MDAMAVYLRCNNYHLFCDVFMFKINLTEMCNKSGMATVFSHQDNEPNYCTIAMVDCLLIFLNTQVFKPDLLLAKEFYTLLQDIHTITSLVENNSE